MSKIGAAFGSPGGPKKPTHREIFEGLRQKKLAEDAAAAAKRAGDTASGAPGSPGGGGVGGTPTSTPNISPAAASEAKDLEARRKKGTRLRKTGGKGPGGAGAAAGTDDDVIKRPGARTAKLLGN